MRAPKVMGVPLWKGSIKKRVAKKYVKLALGERNMRQRLQEMKNYKVGDLISECSGLNSRIKEIDPQYWHLRAGVFLHDIDFLTDKTSCSFYHCGVGPPKTAQECRDYIKELIAECEKNGDEWGFVPRYSKIVVNDDGTHTKGDP